MLHLSRKNNPTPKTLGLALGGGSARGYAHVGILKILEANNVRIDFISGTSIGSLIGGLYAAGITPQEIESYIASIDWSAMAYMFFPTLPKGGLIDGKLVEKVIEGLVGDLRIEDLSIPYAAIACDATTGEEVVITSGRLAAAIRASTSIPVIFQPAVKQGRILIDGGILNVVPTNVCRNLGADFTIAVNVSQGLPPLNKEIEPIYQPVIHREPSKFDEWFKKLLNEKVSPSKNQWLERIYDSLRQRNDSPLGMIEIMYRSIAISGQLVLERSLTINPPDMLITPELTNYNYTDFPKYKEMIAIGEQAILTHPQFEYLTKTFQVNHDDKI